MKVNNPNNIEYFEKQVKEIIINLLKDTGEALDLDKSFLELGINSVLAVELVEAINQKLGTELGIEVVFDYASVKELAEFIYCKSEKKIHPANFDSVLVADSNLSSENSAHDYMSKKEAEISAERSNGYSDINAGRSPDIAIIGISGKFAGSETVEEFWDHLQSGDSCIEEIKRQGWAEYYDSDPSQKNKSISKWGGLLKNIDKFDASFFNISPIEAERMDPQQRLFLEEAFKVFEDSGYSAQQLSGQKVGVFVGGRASSYKDKTLLVEEINSQTFVGNDMSVLAARISYFLNLKGPNLSVDTACSSSLVAIHLACESVRRGESELALAGGVFVIDSPDFYVMTSKTNLLSPDGKCKTFDNAANGIVLGEGVGVMVLKRLEAALEDGDHIYGVIKGSSMNQDGKTKGITAPSMLSQKKLIYETYKNALINPETVSYIEAHGTGTKLGDPIEIKALTEAFRMFTDKMQFCAVGSHKPNFGHTIMTAGIAGVFKVLMAMKYRKIPPAISVEKINEHIDFDTSPFFVNTKLKNWISNDGGPLRAGVSSFGFSGTNCHIIIEEPPKIKNNTGNPVRPYYFFPLSAKSTTVLKQKIADMASWLEKEEGNYVVDDIVYTLLVGRTHFSARCVFVAKDIAELKYRIKEVIENGKTENYFFNEENNCDNLEPMLKELKKYGEKLMEELQETGNLARERYKEKLLVLSHLYIKKYDLNWEEFFNKGKYHRIPLSTYPFAGDSYWIPGATKHQVAITCDGGAAFIHPLLHRNTSDFSEHRFSSIFTGREFFFLDYAGKGKKVLAGEACLEMARAAVKQAAGNIAEEKTTIRLKNVVWGSPMVIGEEPVQVHIGLFPEEHDQIAFEIYGDSVKSGAEPIVYCQGSTMFDSTVEIPLLNLKALEAQCEQEKINSSQYCEANVAMEFNCGSEQRKIEMLQIGKDRALVKLSLPSSLADTGKQFVVHPCLLQGVLQASACLLNSSEVKLPGKVVSLTPSLPLALDEIEILGGCTPSMWALIQFREKNKAGEKGQKFNVDFCDDQGKICVRLKGMEMKPVELAEYCQKHTVPRTKHVLQKQWEHCPGTSNRRLDRCIAILMTQETKELAEKLAQHLQKSELLDLNDLAVQRKQVEEWKTYDGCVDLSGCGESISKSMDWIVWLQQLIEQGHKEGLMLLCVTKGLESYQNTNANLSGACHAGLYRMLQSEYSQLRSRHMDAEASADTETLARQIAAELFMDSEDPEVCYRNGKRYRAMLVALQESGNNDTGLMFPQDQVLWITGGTKGIGYLCARHFVMHHKVRKLVLTGREVLPPREEWDNYEDKNNSIGRKIESIRELEKQGAKVRVLSVALTDSEAVQQSLQEIKNTMGTIGGLIHCAGISDADNPAFIRKNIDGIKTVLEPKVKGLEVLYQSLKEEPLQFIVLFSSVAGIIPSLGAGQSDYAMANAYMDYFARVHRKSSPIVSIQWPSWKEAGMGEIKSRAYQQTGLLSHTDREGLQYLDYVLSQKIGPVVLPAVTNPDKWKPQQLMGRKIQEETTTSIPVKGVLDESKGEANNVLVKATQEWLISLFARELKMDTAKVEIDTPFQDYGLDSILLAQIITKMDRELKGAALDPSALIENSTVRSLARYLTQTYPEFLTALFSIEASLRESAAQSIPNDSKSVLLLQRKKRKGFCQTKADTQKEKVAIIGMACHFPDAANIYEYWENLKLGRDSIREVPKSRWDWEKYYDTQGGEKGKSISKWGAFLEGIEAFDPGYFNISEQLAPKIDPLQRQWLEVSIEALADAGYEKKDLWGKQIGVFAGARTSNFADKLDKSSKGKIIGGGQNFITAHLAHICNFKGPNMVVDTACSSSLTAIHLAVRSIQSKEAEIALAGGVEILLDESVFIALSGEKILSPDGRCKTFDTSANGIGLGEGCGVLVLKSLNKAIADNDKIYGVIDGSAINNDGNTVGVTTPNPEAQRQLIGAAIADANITPDTISYIEAHGTGTVIGDPIELKALTQILSEHTMRKGFCGVGSVKSNIGHLLNAAGVSGIIKVLLAIIHQQIPPTLHCDNPNPRFNFEESPLYLVRGLQDWSSENQVLRAGISAFGLGGNNANIIVSNQGVPDTHKASMVPRGNKVVFKRKIYWPEMALKTYKQESELQEGIQPKQDEEDEFNELFEIQEV